MASAEEEEIAVNPITIIAEINGAETIIGYTCEACQKIVTVKWFRDHSYLNDPTETRTDEQCAYDHTLQCCVCDHCGKVESGIGQYCKASWQLHTFWNEFTRIATAIKLGITNLLVWEIIENELDYGTYMHKLEKYLARYPYYQGPVSDTCDECGVMVQHHNHTLIPGPGGQTLCHSCNRPA